MKTRVQGKVLKVTYSVEKNAEKTEENGKTKYIFSAKPELKKKEEIMEWKDICSYTGLPHYDEELIYGYVTDTMHISENECVTVKKAIFRADLGEYHVQTDKVLDTIEVNKEESEAAYNAIMKTFNRVMIESNEKMMSYCKLHKLDPEETDCVELFHLVYPNEHYCINNGKMRIDYSMSLCACGTISTVIGNISPYGVQTATISTTNITEGTLATAF